MTQEEEAQLAQTIEMFEVITQSQPQDYQSLEILKEAYSKLGREKDVINTSKRIAQAYVQMGQLSSAILEYETILQRQPDDPDVQAALKQIESKANNPATSPAAPTPPSGNPPKPAPVAPEARRQIQRRRWTTAASRCTRFSSRARFITPATSICAGARRILSAPPTDVIEPFIQVLADKGILPVDKSLKLLCDKTRVAFLPLENTTWTWNWRAVFRRTTCRRWCVLPFDRMSKSVLVATANPFNQQAAKELAEATTNRLLWYLVPPAGPRQKPPQSFPLNHASGQNHLVNASPTPWSRTAC